MRRCWPNYFGADASAAARTPTGEERLAIERRYGRPDDSAANTRYDYYSDINYHDSTFGSLLLATDARFISTR